MQSLHDEYLDSLARIAKDINGEEQRDMVDEPVTFEQEEADLAAHLLEPGDMGTANIRGISFSMAKNLIGVDKGKYVGLKKTFDPLGIDEPRPIELFWHQETLIIYLLRAMFQKEGEEVDTGKIVADDVGLGKTLSVLTLISMFSIEIGCQRHYMSRNEPVKRSIPLLGESFSSSSSVLFVLFMRASDV